MGIFDDAVLMAIDGDKCVVIAGIDCLAILDLSKVLEFLKTDLEIIIYGNVVCMCMCM